MPAENLTVSLLSKRQKTY